MWGHDKLLSSIKKTPGKARAFPEAWKIIPSGSWKCQGICRVTTMNFDPMINPMRLYRKPSSLCSNPGWIGSDTSNRNPPRRIGEDFWKPVLTRRQLFGEWMTA